MTKPNAYLDIMAGRRALREFFRAANACGVVYFTARRTSTRAPRDGGGYRYVYTFQTCELCQEYRIRKDLVGNRWMVPRLRLLWPALVNRTETEAALDVVARDWGFSFARRGFYTSEMEEIVIHDLCATVGVHKNFRLERFDRT